MLRLLVFVCLLITLSSSASAPAVVDVEDEVAKPQKNWFYRAFDSIEDTFKGKAGAWKSAN